MAGLSFLIFIATVVGLCLTFNGPARRSLARKILAPLHLPLHRARWVMGITAIIAFVSFVAFVPEVPQERQPASSLVPVGKPTLNSAVPAPAAIPPVGEPTLSAADEASCQALGKMAAGYFISRDKGEPGGPIAAAIPDNVRKAFPGGDQTDLRVEIFTEFMEQEFKFIYDHEKLTDISGKPRGPEGSEQEYVVDDCRMNLTNWASTPPLTPEQIVEAREQFAERKKFNAKSPEGLSSADRAAYKSQTDSIVEDFISGTHTQVCQDLGYLGEMIVDSRDNGAKRGALKLMIEENLRTAVMDAYERVGKLPDDYMLQKFVDSHSRAVDLIYSQPGITPEMASRSIEEGCESAPE